MASPEKPAAGGGHGNTNGGVGGHRGGPAGAMVAQRTPDRNALNGMGEFILTQVRRGASEQQWADWLKVPFEHACLARDMSTIRRLLEAGVNGPYDRPRDPRFRRHTLLHLSSACGNTEPSEKAYTPLHRAVLGGHSEVARVLIKAGADKDARTGGSGATPLHLAARKGHESCLRTLLLTGADKDSKRGLDGATPLHQAAFFGQMGAVRELLESLADPNAQDAEGCTPVFLASQEGHEEVVVDLLRNGASPDMSREDGWAPLHAAARFGHSSTAAALLTEGRADYEAVTEDHGSTPLHVAAISGFDEVLTVLLDVGCDVESADSGGWTPLHCACAAARASCVNTLIMRGADPSAITPEGKRAASLIGTDLAEGDEPNSETNETIWKMLRVPRAESEARRRRRTAKNAGNQRPPPPYNDRPPPAYGPDSVGGIVVFDSAGSGSATGSASGSFSGSGSRQLHRSPTHPQEAPAGSGGKGSRRGAAPTNGHRDANGGGIPRERSATRRGDQQHQQQSQRKPRERVREFAEGQYAGKEGDLEGDTTGVVDPAAVGGGGGGGLRGGGGSGYKPTPDQYQSQPRPSRDKRVSTDVVVGGVAAGRPAGRSPAAGGVGVAGETRGAERSPPPTGKAGSQGERGVSFSLSPPAGGRGGSNPPQGSRKGGSQSPPPQQQRGGTSSPADRRAAAMGEKHEDEDGDVEMELESAVGVGGEAQGRRNDNAAVGQESAELPRILRRPAGAAAAAADRTTIDGARDARGASAASTGSGRIGGAGGRPSIATDGRRSSAGRASGGAGVFNSDEAGEDGRSSGSTAFGERPGGGGGFSMGAAEGIVASRIAAYDPFSYSQKDAQSSGGTPRHADM
ncbi:ankyrin repeat protein [Ectocarpus siliculosus]|uniref:Ankyrin repeat protein n=1 Tax=Ectocarpus siliculosus TaxID=2880 RepID=D7FH38_ECTSI|nr:ankyrin repeat protein [Ectocarpus siliculosus]|eukprot:CBJ28413.1 ankyrin repeat protein [Ectocarpus siliculosus]